MAYVSGPKDLTRGKSKVALNLTKRQLICFGAAAVIGIPAYIFTRGTIGNSAAALLMIGLMLPLFMFAMYEKDGLPAEILLRNYIRARFIWPDKRPYKTENRFEILIEEARSVASKNKEAAIKIGDIPNPGPVGKRPAGKKQSR